MASLLHTLRTVLPWLPSVAVLALGLLLTYAVFDQQRSGAERVAHARYIEQVEAAKNTLNQRLLAYTEVVAGLRDLYLIRPELDHRDFARIAEGHDVRRSYPELKSLSFTRSVPAAGLGAFERTLQQQRTELGLGPLPPMPSHDANDYYIIEHVWPFAGNERLWGLDIHSQPNNLASLLNARNSGRPSVSGPFPLLQGGALPLGFMLRFPVHLGDGDTRRFIGAIAASIHVRSMMEALERSGFVRGLALKLEDLGPVSGLPDSASLLGSSRRWPADALDHAWLERREINVHDRLWRLSFLPVGQALSAQERQLPLWVSVGGGLSSLLLALVVGVLIQRHLDTLKAVLSTHRALELSEDRFLAVFNQAAVGIALMDSVDGHFLRVNRKCSEILGYDERELVQLSIASLSHPDEHAEAERMRERLRSGEALEHHCERRLRHKNGSWVWVDLTISSMFDSLEERPCHVGVIQDIGARKAAQAEVDYLAYHDVLTQLPNRRQLLERLPQILAVSERRQRFGALLMFDLDHFKLLNETLGHEQGDLLLREVAARLRSGLNKGNLVVRHGDDEFVVVIDDLASSSVQAAARAEDQGQALLELLRLPVELDEGPYLSTVSMGISLFVGEEVGVDELLSRADLAMNEAKQGGRNALRFYDPALQALISARAQLSTDMQHALRLGQYELFYQAQLEGRCIVGAEVLLRWRHPQDGLVSPATFIPLAEETGFITELGNWVLHTACEQLARWQQQEGPQALVLAVNVSPRQFHQEDFVERVLEALASSGAHASQLKLELTEGLLLHDVDDTIKKMARLKAYGVSFSLDDFGTGYSSLAYLKRLPLDQLKIDQSFVRDVLTDPNDAAIARTVVALATSLGLGVIAEGVETEAQLDFLERNGCHAWQGYLFSRPLPITEFEALLAATAT